MSFHEDMFALLKTDDWQACHRRIDEEPGDTRESRVAIAGWRSSILRGQGRYDEALRAIDASKDDVFTQCGYLFDRARILQCMGKTADAIETLRQAPFGSEIDAFPALTYEAIFLYCYLLKQAGREPPPNLLAALPDDFGTHLFGRMREKADLLPPEPDSPAPA
ncbi:hypothetical protein DFR50_13463 [Roseiarcus fermentans]|uniref:Tetratricopeptide repeat protein n=1 Tax=Roseiarcus fermentans TaxID=1473586 RepID=A0A366EVG9_9HYPH|nr:hypothetical protein [Roseiarcus fermentans]RBP05700.1 hypothetical protein DFR50_13463 [Roseiarcus fermentans]